MTNAESDAAIAEAAERLSFAEILAAEGVTPVGLDADGRFLERRPDGTRVVLD